MVVSARYRNWSGIVYPDSAPDDWLEHFQSLCVKGFVSPLHDSDLNPDGEEKKPHYHVLLIFDGKKSFEQVSAIFDYCNSPHPQFVQSAEGMARYLCHLDNPEKAQYSTAGVVGLAGMDYLSFIERSSDVDRIINEMEDFVDQQGIISYAALSRYARQNRPDWARALRHKCTVHMKAYIQSCTWESSQQ